MADLEKLDNAIKELEIQSNDLKDFNQVYSEIVTLKDGISNSLSSLRENNEGFSTITLLVKSRLEESKKQIESLENTLLSKIRELYQDNQNFQKELDASLITRLDKHKSDIQVEIRNEGSQIQRGLENSIDSKLNKMESKLENILEIQKKQLSDLKIIIIVLVVITLGSIAVSLFY